MSLMVFKHNTPFSPIQEDIFSTKRGQITLAAFLLALALSACAPLVFAQDSPRAADQTPAGREFQGIGTARLDTVWQMPERSAPAQVVARNESRLAAEVAGPLLRWNADIGTTVKKGEVLAQIDPTDLDLALQRAQAARDAADARLTLAEAQLKRARELVAQGFFSQEALAQRETEVALLKAERDSAQALWQTARRQRDKTTVRAPFAGAVVQRLAQTGEMVAPGTPLFVLAQTDQAEVSAPLTPNELAGLQAARNVTFEPDTGPPPLQVRLLRATPTLQGVSRTQTARLAFQFPQHSAPAGASGVLRWLDPTPHIPVELMVRRGQHLGIFVAADGKAQFVVLPGAQEGRAVPTRLPGDSQVVVKGQARLTHGQALN